MCKENVKIGRYSKERHKNHKSLMIQRNQSSFVRSPYETYVQDTIVICSSAFSSAVNFNWTENISDFNSKFENLQSIIELGFFEKDVFLDVYKVVGVEIDQRKIVSEFFEEVASLIFKQFLISVRKLPGLDELPLEDFLELIVQNKDDVRLLYQIMFKYTHSNNVYSVDFNENHKLIIGQSETQKILDEDISNQFDNFSIEVNKICPSYEEIVFLIAMDMLKPGLKTLHLKSIYEKFTLSFSRYLEHKYDTNYIQRFQKLINLITQVKLLRHNMNKWFSKQTDYKSYLYDFSVFSEQGSYETALSAFNDLKVK